jgi:extradiol dioxygenase family protein
MDHIVLNVEDEDEMIAFYAQVLRFTPERVREYRAGDAPFPSVRLNPDTIIDLFPQKLWRRSDPAGQGRANLNHFCITLSEVDWNSLTARLKARNIDIEEGPVQRWGAHGEGTSIYFRDPEGNQVEARYYRAKARI